MGTKRYAKRGTVSGQSRCAVVLSALLNVYPKWKTHGFGEAVRTLFPDYKELHEYLARVRPDAYAIHPDEKEIDIIEIVDTHPISREKGRAIGAISDMLFGEDWTVGVVCFDASGNLTSHIPGVYYSSFYTQGGSEHNATPLAVHTSRLTGEVTTEELEALIGKISSL